MLSLLLVLGSSHMRKLMHPFFLSIIYLSVPIALTFASWAWVESDFVFKAATTLSATSERSLSFREGASDPAGERFA